MKHILIAIVGLILGVSLSFVESYNDIKHISKLHENMIEKSARYDNYARRTLENKESAISALAKIDLMFESHIPKLPDSAIKNEAILVEMRDEIARLVDEIKARQETVNSEEARESS